MKIKKFVRNYRNNNLPETLFLIGVFVLSIGLFIEPQSTWFLGIHFYKSDLQTITTIAKIFGTVIISSSIILNLKKYTNKEGTQHFNHEKDKIIDKENEEEKEPDVDIEKLKKNLIKTGKSVSAIGWLMVIISTGVFLWGIFDNNFHESGLSKTAYSTFFIIIINYIVFIILGNRIKNLVDKKIKIYIQIILILSFVFLIFIIYTGGTIGILFFLLTGYLISSLVQISRAMRVKAFTSTLTSPKYKLDKYGWGYFIGISLVVFTILLVLDLNTSKTDWNKEYGIESNLNEDKSRYTLQELQRMGAEPGYKDQKDDNSYETFLDNKQKDINTQASTSKSAVATKTETGTTTNLDTSNWVTYKSQEDNFSIMFSKTPERSDSIVSSTEENNDNSSNGSRLLKTTYVYHGYEDNNYPLSVGVLIFPDTVDISNQKEFLDKIILVMTTPNDDSYTITTVSSDPYIYNGNYSSNLTLKYSNSEMLSKYRVILVGHRVYLIKMGYYINDYNKEIYNKFINSFKIL